MNKVDIANAVHAKLGGTKVQAEEVLDTVIDSIVSTLKKGGDVSIAGLGIFTQYQMVKMSETYVPVAYSYDSTVKEYEQKAKKQKS